MAEPQTPLAAVPTAVPDRRYVQFVIGDTSVYIPFSAVNSHRYISPVVVNAVNKNADVTKYLIVVSLDDFPNGPIGDPSEIPNITNIKQFVDVSQFQTGTIKHLVVTTLIQLSNGFVQLATNVNDNSTFNKFRMEKPLACTSKTIDAMFQNPLQSDEGQTNEISFNNITPKIMNKVCEYMVYKNRYANSTVEIPEYPLTADIALELLMAANFLDI
jgi:transcription elongation factor B subunit 1